MIKKLGKFQQIPFENSPSRETQRKLLGKLYIIAAPSGTGKTSLVDVLLKNLAGVALSISHTTRERREGEIEGVHYHFISKPEFEQMIDNQVFLEYARVYGNLYGTSKLWVEETINQGIDVVLEIDWQGAEQIRSLFSNTVSIFILPPSKKSLRDRLMKRQQDDPTTIERRLQALNEEVSHCHEFNHVIVNDNFAKALEELQGVFQGVFNSPYSEERFGELVRELMTGD